MDGLGEIRVRWNAGFVASVGGLFKNAFAAMEWRLGLSLGGAAVCRGGLASAVFDDRFVFRFFCA